MQYAIPSGGHHRGADKRHPIEALPSRPPGSQPVRRENRIVGGRRAIERDAISYPFGKLVHGVIVGTYYLSSGPDNAVVYTHAN